MPAKSKQQQKFFGVVRAMQKGDIPKKGEAGDVADDMKKSDVKDFASTKHKNLPKKIKREENMSIKKWIKQEIKQALKENDAFKPEFGTGDVVHDCPKHVQEVKTGKKGLVVAHSLNESGEVNYVDVDFGTGKVFKNIPTKKLTVLEGRTHEHATKSEPKLKERNIARQKVDYSTMNLVSNIDIKWTSTEDMENDLRQWLEGVFEASGAGLVREVGTVLKDIGTAAIKDGSIGDDELPMDKMGFSNQ
tara:strand:+ start:116 stop:856 length:741 start_codon:yes stop_codon:yes gene_type:complete